MTEVYTNSFFDSPEELNSSNFFETISEYTAHLEKTAKEFKTLVKFLKSKKIKVLAAKGYPYVGSFSVDDIDLARLKKEGFVVDMTESPNTENPTFYIDEELDKEFKDSDIIDEEFTPVRNIDGYSPPTVNLDEDEIEEKSSLVNLGQILREADAPVLIKDADDEFTPGTIVVDVQQLGDHQYSFNLTVADLNDDPIDVKFNREKAQFEYKCGSCEETHVESIASVFRSLKTTGALLSNLVAMIKKPKELAVALDFIDHDLRLLQSLVAFDYALSDDEGLVDDDDEDNDDDGYICNHDHSDDEDEDEDDEDEDDIDDIDEFEDESEEESEDESED